jgi:hypothetical protein
MKMAQSPLELAVEQIAFARGYTIRLLDDTDPADWFRQPAGATHLAWQVGHLAMAEYRLALDRVRGPRPEDADLISPEFLNLFRRQSTPYADPAKYPSPAEIRAVFDRVHVQTLRELRELDEAALEKPVEDPHYIAKTRLWCLLWCSHHEMIHAGQIGLLRRQFGRPAQW